MRLVGNEQPAEQLADEQQQPAPTKDDYDSTTWDAGQELILACDPQRERSTARAFVARLIRRYGTDVVNAVIHSIASRDTPPLSINAYFAAACREESKRRTGSNPRARTYRVPYQLELVTEAEYRAWEERARQTGYLPADWGQR